MLGAVSGAQPHPEPQPTSVWAQYAKGDDAAPAPPAPAGPAGPTGPPEPRGCLPTFLVAVLMFAIAFSGAIAFAAVESDPLPIVEVDGPVSIQPLRGWEFVSRSEDGTAIFLSQGSGSLTVEVITVEATPDEVLEATFASWESEPETQLSTGAREAVETAPGIVGVRASYGGVFPEVEYPVEGELTVVAGGGVLVVFDAWAGEGELRLVLDEIRQMIAGTTYS
jgi:hypothetical protein